MKQRIYYFLLRFFLFLGKIIPKDCIYRVTQWGMHHYYRRKPKRVERMHANIRRAYPDFSEEQIVEFGRKVYHETAKTAVEFVLMYNDRVDIDRMIVNAEEAIATLHALHKEATNGIIYIMAHYGNWELLGHFMAKNGFPLVGVVKEGKNSWIEQKILIPFRAKYGNTPVGHASSMIAITKALKVQKSVSLAIDQVVQPPNGVVVDFFGHATAATKAIAMLKLKYDPLVVPIFLTRVGKEKFTVQIYAPIEVAFEEGISKEKKVVMLTEHYYDVIEKQIRQVPEQWLWFYNRWKEIRYA